MKKALIISYYWPPSGKASIHLPLGIIRHLPKFDIEPIVLTVENDSFSMKDDSSDEFISHSLRVIKSPAAEPFDIYKRFTGKKSDSPLVASETISLENKNLTHRISIWIRMNLFIPDARIGWYPYAMRAMKKFLQTEPVDYILSFGPPHSTHLIARKLSRRFSIPYYPIFIDPWVDIAYYRNFKRNAVTLKIDRHLEKKILSESKANFFVTKGMCDDYCNKYPAAAGKSHVIYWGYDEKMFTGLSQAEPNKQLTIVHAGNIFDYQNPEMLWKYMRERLKADQNFLIRFIGTVSPAVSNSIVQYGLAERTEYLGFLSYTDMLNQLNAADILLVCATEKRHVPGKLFEYMRIGKPILAFGDDNAEVMNILKETNAGQLFGYNEDPAGFFDRYSDFQRDLGIVSKFDRYYAAESLANVLLQSERI